MKKIIVAIVASVIAISCNTKQEQKITTVLNANDYNKYLASTSISLKSAKEQQAFWQKRLAVDSSGLGDLAPLASSYLAMFNATGNVENLYSAERLYKKAMDIAANNKDVYARALARNYISQHRFKEAKKLLETSYVESSNKRATEYQLFDVYMETGNYEKAYENLEKIKNPSSYDYLIRIAKWSDYRGDLDAAINYLEQARDIVVKSGNKGLKIWTYSNLGDFYGHAGRIDEAYTMYLKTLQLEPDNAYVKKALAWIAYSKERNTVEANRILDSIMKYHNVPEYHLLKSEMATFDGNPEEAKIQENLFLKSVNKTNYGAMYNGYLIELFAESNPEKSLELAKEEVSNRATPETYHLLALAQLKNNMPNDALKTIETYVEGKTEEPMALLHAAYVFKANNLDDKVVHIKKELEDTAFEIGPVLSEKVAAL